MLDFPTEQDRKPAVDRPEYLKPGRRPRRSTVKGGGGEIVQVQGGHIIRSTGRKDRHSKVYTAKGPRDRRVRLAVHTAIQFYDVQDRLGYDRPSKAVDWLIKKAKYAIDKLAELPPFDPAAGDGVGPVAEVGEADLEVGGGEQSESASGYEIRLPSHHQPQPAGLDCQPFFPAATTAENSMGHYPHQDLCLSLQSFHDASHTLFPAGFDVGSGGGGGWSSEANAEDMGRFSRLLAWNGSGGGGVAEEFGGGGERGTLQSSFHPPASIRAWDDLPMGAAGDHKPSSMAGIGVLGWDGFMGFCIPPQMHGGAGASDGQEVHGAFSHNLHRVSSMSTDSCH